MARWEPDAQGRLQQAAMTLFLERGYAEVTVAEIADRAGLTKRTFFNHFADKREVFFAGAKDLEASVIRHLAEAGDDLDPIDAAIVALARGMDAAVSALADRGLDLDHYRDYARARRDLIASSPELRERDLIKMNSLAAAIAAALTKRRVPPRTAALAAQAAVIVFATADDAWVDDTSADRESLMRRSLAELRQAIGPRLTGDTQVVQA